MSRILEEIYESINSCFAAGIIDIATLQKFAEFCAVDNGDD